MGYPPVTDACGRMALMTITLEPEVEAMVRKKVQDGLYGDAQAIIRKALSLLDERDKLRQLRAKLQIA